MILPYNDPLVKLLFKALHEKNKRSGFTALLANINQRFLSIKVKITARSVVTICVRCSRARPRLPANYGQSYRSSSNASTNSRRILLWTFLDHYMVEIERQTKVYLALFCCFVSEAAHLELVTDLPTNAFIGALKRFTTLRGRC